MVFGDGWNTIAIASVETQGMFAAYENGPFGLDDIFSFRIAPNRALDNQRTHEAKGRRARECWPEITVVPW